MLKALTVTTDLGVSCTSGTANLSLHWLLKTTMVRHTSRTADVDISGRLTNIIDTISGFSPEKTGKIATIKNS